VSVEEPSLAFHFLPNHADRSSSTSFRLSRKSMAPAMQASVEKRSCAKQRMYDHFGRDSRKGESRKGYLAKLQARVLKIREDFREIIKGAQSR